MRTIKKESKKGSDFDIEINSLWILKGYEREYI